MGFFFLRTYYQRVGYEQATKDQQAAAYHRLVTQTQVTERVVTKYVPQVEKIYVQGKEVVKRIPVYITKADDSRCVINNGFVRVWNAANAGMSLPATPSSVDEKASAVILSDVEAEHATEATLCRAVTKQLEALQEWNREQAKIK